MRLRNAWIGVCAVAAIVVAPCAAPVGTGGTGLKTYARGALASVAGRVSVSGIDWQAASASITINGARGRTQQDLRDGMMASVAGEVDDTLTRGTASVLRVDRVALGKAMRVGTGGTGLRVAGLDLIAASSTVIAGAPSLADVADGDWLEVYGYADGMSGSVQATRVERVAPQAATQLHGVITAATPAALTVNGVDVDISHATFTGFARPPAAGQRVVVDGAEGSTGIAATEVRAEAVPELGEAQDAEVEDAIEAVIDSTHFVVADVEVDASAATFVGGTAADVAAGRVVDVHGHVVAGVLVATTVAFDDFASEGGEASAGAEVEGAISAVAVDGSFVVHGVTVEASGATFANGTAQDVAVGRRVEVTGSRDGARLRARHIRFDDASGTRGSGTGGWSGGHVPGSAARIEGRVTSLDDASRFRIGTVLVDASSARFVHGSPADLKAGVHVQASGTWAGATLVAAVVSLDD